jgi:hypothetical protein
VETKAKKERKKKSKEKRKFYGNIKQRVSDPEMVSLRA